MPSASFQATVVSMPSVGGGHAAPTLSSTKLPVPYVFFAMPGSKHACPNSAACWSPAMPLIGMPAGTPQRSDVTPKRPLDGTHLGQRVERARGAARTARRPTPGATMSNSIVRLALVGVGGVAPRRRSGSTAARCRSCRGRGRRRRGDAALAQQPLELRAAEVRIEHEPGARPHESRCPGGGELVAARRGAAVLPHDRRGRRAPGRAVPGDDGLALVGDADRRDGSAPTCSTTSSSVALTASQISAASCSTQPGRGKCCVNSR